MAKTTRKTETTARALSTDMRNNIEDNQMYIIKERVFNNTNEEWAKLGRGKSPSLVEADVIPARWHDRSKRYDLGLTADSTDFSGKTESEIEEILEQRAFVKKAFERTFGAHLFTTLITNEESFAETSAYPQHERVLNTNNDDNLIELWLMLLSNTVCFKGEENQQKYNNNAIYVIEPFSQKAKFEETVADDKMNLTKWFVATSHADREKVVMYMNFISPSVKSEMNDATLYRIFNDMLESPKDREQLKDIILFKNEEKIERIRIATIINKALREGVIKEKNNEFFYNEARLAFGRPNTISLLNSNRELLNEIEKTLK